MRIGVAREIKPDEYRVALTPAGALELTQHGHEVLVEKGAGDGQRLPGRGLRRASGARIASVDEVWEAADLLLKVKEPIAARVPPAARRTSSSSPICTSPPTSRSRARSSTSGVTAVAYETVELDNGRCRCSRRCPRSPAGSRRRWARGLLEKSQGGRGILLGGVPGVAPAKVVDPRRRHRRLQRGARRGRDEGARVGPRAVRRAHARARGRCSRAASRCDVARSSSSTRSVADADLVVGAVLIPGARAPKLITREMIGR